MVSAHYLRCTHGAEDGGAHVAVASLAARQMNIGSAKSADGDDSFEVYLEVSSLLLWSFLGRKNLRYHISGEAEL